MRQVLQIALPVVVLGVAGLVTKMIVSNPNKPKTRKVETPVVYVEIQEAKKENFPITVMTQGEVQARIASKIIPEVSGKIIEVSDNFFAGRFFKKNDILVKLDPRDYEIALEKAKADLVKAETAFEQEKIRTQNFKTAVINAQNTLQKNILTLKEEEARAEQALTDWKKLGREGTPGELVLRKPQLNAARAAVTSSKADIEKAQRDLTLIDTLLKNAKASVSAAKAEVRQREIDLERCYIRAPFNGRIVNKSVDVGQFVSTGSAIADIYGIDAVEIRLPVSPRDLQFMDLPGDSPDTNSYKPEVTFTLERGNEELKWKGVIDRTESRMNSQSRQYYIVGQVKDPFKGEYSLKPGVFVKAGIKGDTLEDVYIVPISSVRESTYLWLVDNESKLRRKNIKVIWRNKEIAVIRGLADGDRICKTTLTFAQNGLDVVEKGKEIKK